MESSFTRAQPNTQQRAHARLKPGAGRAACFVSLLLLYGGALTGCGGGDDGGDEPSEGGCYIAVSVEGAVDFEQSKKDLFCLYLTSYESGVSTVFIPYDEPFDGITLDIEEIQIDQVGTFPATLSFSHEDGRTFRADDCEVSIETHEPDGEPTDSGLSYQMRGNGTCQGPALLTTGSTESLTIAPFEFSTGVIWDT